MIMIYYELSVLINIFAYLVILTVANDATETSRTDSLTESTRLISGHQIAPNCDSDGLILIHDSQACRRICTCDANGSISRTCDESSGQCVCKQGFGGLKCNQCSRGHFKEVGISTEPTTWTCNKCNECYDHWPAIVDEMKNLSMDSIGKAHRLLLDITTTFRLHQVKSENQSDPSSQRATSISDVDSILTYVGEKVVSIKHLGDMFGYISSELGGSLVDLQSYIDHIPAKKEALGQLENEVHIAYMRARNQEQMLKGLRGKLDALSEDRLEIKHRLSESAMEMIHVDWKRSLTQLNSTIEFRRNQAFNDSDMMSKIKYLIDEQSRISDEKSEFELTIMRALVDSLTEHNVSANSSSLNAFVADMNALFANDEPELVQNSTEILYHISAKRYDMHVAPNSDSILDFHYVRDQLHEANKDLDTTWSKLDKITSRLSVILRSNSLPFCHQASPSDDLTCGKLETLSTHLTRADSDLADSQTDLDKTVTAFHDSNLSEQLSLIEYECNLLLQRHQHQLETFLNVLNRASNVSLVNCWTDMGLLENNVSAIWEILPKYSEMKQEILEIETSTREVLSSKERTPMFGTQETNIRGTSSLADDPITSFAQPDLTASLNHLQLRSLWDLALSARLTSLRSNFILSQRLASSHNKLNESKSRMTELRNHLTDDLSALSEASAILIGGSLKVGDEMPPNRIPTDLARSLHVTEQFETLGQSIQRYSMMILNLKEEFKLDHETFEEQMKKLNTLHKDMDLINSDLESMEIC